MSTPSVELDTLPWSGKLDTMASAPSKVRKCWLLIEGGPMDGTVFAAMMAGVLPAKIFGPDINQRMSGVYERVGIGHKMVTYRLRDDAQQQTLEKAWTDYLMLRLTREELDEGPV